MILRSRANNGVAPVIAICVALIVAALFVVLSRKPSGPVITPPPPAGNNGGGTGGAGGMGGTGTAPVDPGPKTGPSDPTPAPAAEAEALLSLPASVMEFASYPLKECKAWPEIKDLKALSALQESERPAPNKIQDLIAEARQWLSPLMIPSRPEDHVRVGADGKLFLGLGPSGKSGLLSRAMVAKMETLAINRPFQAANDEAGLKRVLEATFSKALVEELGKEKHQLRVNPNAKDGLLGTAILDPQGCGGYFQYLYCYRDGRGLIAVLQQVPHRMEPPPPPPK